MAPAPYSDLEVAPEHYADQSGLQIPEYSGLHHVATYTPPAIEYKVETPILPQPERKIICGVAARTFWIILTVIAAILVIGAAVGGGIGASLAANNSRKSHDVANSAPSALAQGGAQMTSTGTTSASSSTSASSGSTSSSSSASSGSSTGSHSSSSSRSSSSTSHSSSKGSPSPPSHAQSPGSSSSSSSSKGPITPSPASSPPPQKTTQIVLPTTTLLSDCPSSNDTVYNVNIGGDMSFRKLCGRSYHNGNNGAFSLSQKTTSLNDCINLCAAYNIKDEDSIKSGDKLVCNTVCWRNQNDPAPGECYGYKTSLDTSDVNESQSYDICDSGTWINPSF